ncbi:MAG: hypothetical protein WC928_02455 [Patescibacteria group bacterium]|jgi:hypothetical protein
MKMKTKFFMIVVLGLGLFLSSCAPKNVWVDNLEFNGLGGDGYFINTIGANYGDTIFIWETINFDSKNVNDNVHRGLISIDDWNRKTKNFGRAIVVWHYGGETPSKDQNDWISRKTTVSIAVVAKKED